MEARLFEYSDRRSCGARTKYNKSIANFMQMCTFSLRKMGEVKDKTRREGMRGGETAALPSLNISIILAFSLIEGK